MPSSAEARESIWERSLLDGAGFSCLLGSGAGQALEGFWRDVFRTSRPGSRILEIGCGAADVSAWAAEAGRGLEVIASDIHDRPEVVELRPGMAFLGNARAEALPLAAGAVDMVVSNFAFEYSPSRLLAACELVRVLRPGGGAALVLHSDDSEITAINRNHLQICGTLAEAAVPDRIRQAAALRADHLSRRKLLKDVLRLRGAFPAGEPYFAIAERLLRNEPGARQAHEALERDVERATEIARTQVAAALDSSALAWLKNQFAGLRMDLFTTEITGAYGSADRRKFGWLMFMNKPWCVPAAAPY